MSNNISQYSRYNGISGLVSGMDTEALVKKALAKDIANVEKMKAEKQMLIWKQESYHNIMAKITAFTDTYHDVMNTESYFLSERHHNTVEFSNVSGTASKFIDITANSSATKKPFTINSIQQLATSSTATSSSKTIGSIKGSKSLSYPLTLAEGTSFRVIVDGEMKEISIDGTFNNGDDLKNALNSKFNQEFGDGKVVASLSATNELQLSSQNSVLQVVEGTGSNSFLNEVGIKEGEVNIVNVYKSLEDTFGETETVKFKINDVDFSFDKSTKLKDIMSEINSSKANVVLTYSSLTDKFTITSKNTGETSEINIENQQGNLFGTNSYLNINQTKYKNGQDAIIYINDPSKASPIRRSSNKFTIDGVTFDLKETTNEEIKYEVKQDTDGIVEKIKNYIADFNALISDLSSKTTEKIYKDYKPLTDEQKKEMTENQIKLWEEKAKSGMHRYDTEISKMVNDLKDAFWSKVEGASSNLYKAGIQTSEDYKNFEIAIDEDKLKEALETDAESVWDLFAKDSDIDYTRTLSNAEYSQRHSEIGFARRISDIIKDNMSTRRNTGGYKGIFVELAGVDNDASQDTNDISEKLRKIELRVKDAISRMETKETSYWKKFTAMERALQKMNTQSNWLASQLSN